jgi:hypothetical protein
VFGEGMDNYEVLVERIGTAASVDAAEIERRVEAKRAKLSGLVSKEGAAQIVAAELGINFDQERIEIKALVQGMRRANILGKVLEIGEVRTFERNGREGKVVRLRVADQTSNVPVVFWDTHHIALVENGEITLGCVLEISQGGVRNGELHLSSFSDVKVSQEKLDDVVEQQQYMDRGLVEAKVGEKLQARAIVVQAFSPRSFEVSKSTGRKPTEEEKSNGAEIVKRPVLSLVLDDGTETMRCVLFGDQVYDLGLTDEVLFGDDWDGQGKAKLLGKEKVFAGQVRFSDFAQANELTVESVGEVKPAELLAEMQGSAQ